MLKCWQDFYNEIKNHENYDIPSIKDDIWFNGEIAVILSKLGKSKIILEYIILQVKHEVLWKCVLESLFIYYENNSEILVEGLLRNLTIEELYDDKQTYHWSFRILAIFRLGMIAKSYKKEGFYCKYNFNKKCINLLKTKAKDEIENFLKNEEKELTKFSSSHCTNSTIPSFSGFDPEDTNLISAVKACLKEIEGLR